MISLLFGIAIAGFISRRALYVRRGSYFVPSNPSLFPRQRPDISPPILRIDHSEPEKLAPGYIFITPYESENPGPYIFDNTGVSLGLRREAQK